MTTKTNAQDVQDVQDVAPVIPEKSKGQIFKEKYGFSKTFKRNMQRNGFDPFSAEQRQAYRKFRNNKSKQSKFK